ncbi:MAG: ABC transporter permease, partial [Bacteroidales bacterium]
FSLGFVIASLAPTSWVSQVVGMVLFYPMLFLSGASIPLQIMPGSIQKIADFLPLTYVVKLLQGVWFGEPAGEHLFEILILTGLLVVCALISALTFRWECTASFSLFRPGSSHTHSPLTICRIYSG